MDKENKDDFIWLGKVTLAIFFVALLICAAHLGAIRDERVDVCKYGWNGTMEGNGINDHICLSSYGKEIYIP
jgi:hypothetical protein